MSTFGTSNLGIEKDDVSTFGISGTLKDGAAGASTFAAGDGMSTLGGVGMSILGIFGTLKSGILISGALKSGILISPKPSASLADFVSAGLLLSFSFAAFTLSTAIRCFSFSAA